MQALPPPYTLIALEQVDSTNDEARRLAAQGAVHGTVVWARQQTAGRGRRGRQWVSSSGNLHCSILLDPGPSVADAPQLAFVAAVAVCEALSNLAPAAAFRCKWPNDILCNGKKIVGMLLESAGSTVVVGIGVNVVTAPDTALYPTAWLGQTGSGADAFHVLAELCDRLAFWHTRWRQQGFSPIRQAWLGYAIGVGGPITVRLSDSTSIEGRFIGLDGRGALMLETPDGAQRPVLAGDVFILR